MSAAPDLRTAAEAAAEELEGCADMLAQWDAPADSCIGKTITSANAAADSLRASLAAAEGRARTLTTAVHGMSLETLRDLWRLATPLRMPELPPHELGAREVAFAQGIEAALSARLAAATDSLYWRLHSLATALESSGRIDQHEHRDAYPAILDAMNALRFQPDAEPIGWGGVMATCVELCDPHFIAQQDLDELKRYAGNWNSVYRFFPIYASEFPIPSQGTEPTKGN